MPEQTAANRQRVLEGVRVLELGQLIAGTYGGMLLADFGADVIKVESPAGDIGRNPQVSSIKGYSALFMTMNRGKRSVVLDLKSPAGLNAFFRLVANADVVIANYRAGVLERLGIDYARLRESNPSIILCNITGFGRTAAGAEPPSFDLTHQALSGLMSVTGQENGAPVRVGIPIADMGTAVFAVLGVVSAIVGRQNHGRGSEIDLSMLETASFLLGYDATMFLNTGVEPKALGTAHAYSVPWQAFPTADGWLVVAVREEKFWRAYCAAIGMPELVEDARFISNAERIRNRELLVPLLSERMVTRTTQGWLSLMADSVPVSPVRSVAEALSDDALVQSRHVIDVPFPPLGSVRMLRNPVRFDNTDDAYGPPPDLGADTAEVLSSIGGLSNEEITELEARRQATTGGAR
jgi:crotonobetainyl-CoA:carnitine CoA-transferase CaiB-like acyl-CoA transferase